MKPPLCEICGKPMQDCGIEWMCDVVAHNWEMTYKAMDNVVDMTDPRRNKLRDLVSRIRPDVEVAGWVYRELEKLVKEWR